MENQHILMPFSKVIHYLRMHCHTGMTGAFYIATDQGHWGEFLIEKGHVVVIRFRALRGIKALQLLRRSATQAKYSFDADGFKLEAGLRDGEVLPETEKILQFLAKPPSSPAEQAAKPDSAPVPAAPPTTTGARAGELRAMAGLPPRGERPAATKPAAAPAPAAAPGAAPAPRPTRAAPPTTARTPQQISRREAATAIRSHVPARAVDPNAPVAVYSILVVEDSVISRKVITNTLAPRGYRLIEAGDGYQALAQLTNEKPDLVLLDLVLPGMDGYKVLSHMKKKPEFERIPVIILTSRSTLFDKLKGKMSGSDEYLTKPFSSVELVDKVSKYLK